MTSLARFFRVLHCCSYGILMQDAKTAHTRGFHVAEFLLVIVSGPPVCTSPIRLGQSANQVRRLGGLGSMLRKDIQGSQTEQGGGLPALTS
jgi:hypothetical protein